MDTVLIKASIAILVYRLATANFAYRYIIVATIIAFSVWAFACFLFTLLACQPISSFWNSTPNTCLSLETQHNMSRAFGALNIASDWLFALLPIPMLYNVKMSACQKFWVCSLLSMGVM